MFNRDVKVYVYPFKPDAKSELLTSENVEIKPRIKPLYNFLDLINELLIYMITIKIT